MKHIKQQRIKAKSPLPGSISTYAKLTLVSPQYRAIEAVSPSFEQNSSDKVHRVV